MEEEHIVEVEENDVEDIRNNTEDIRGNVQGTTINGLSIHSITNDMGNYDFEESVFAYNDDGTRVDIEGNVYFPVGNDDYETMIADNEVPENIAGEEDIVFNRQKKKEKPKEKKEKNQQRPPSPLKYDIAVDNNEFEETYFNGNGNLEIDPLDITQESKYGTSLKQKGYRSGVDCLDKFGIGSWNGNKPIDFLEKSSIDESMYDYKEKFGSTDFNEYCAINFYLDNANIKRDQKFIKYLFFKITMRLCKVKKNYWNILRKRIIGIIKDNNIDIFSGM